MAIKRRTGIQAEFSMSSLTDIIFLLLIFFMLTSTFVAPNGIKLFLPKSKGPQIVHQTVTVSVNEDLNYYVMNEQVSLGEMENAIKQYMTGSEDDAIILRADKEITHGDFVTVLNICNKVTKKVVIATRPE